MLIFYKCFTSVVDRFHKNAQILCLRPYHIGTQVLVGSPRLSSTELGQYLDGHYLGLPGVVYLNVQAA